MDQNRRNELKNYFGKMNEPVVIVDKDLKCVYSNRPKLLPEDLSIEELVCGETAGLLSEPGARLAIIGGCSYSAKFTPIDEGLYVCCFYDVSAIIRLAENTDLYQKLFPMVDAVEFCSSALWRDLALLKSDKFAGGGANKIVSDMEIRLTVLNSASKNISEYLNMYKYKEKYRDPINLVSFARDVIARCNMILSGVGRGVEFICVEKEIFVFSQTRHLLNALVNAIQNALVYSTRDCVPCFTLSKRNGEAVITLVNNSALYFADGSEKQEVELVGQRLGYGIPIIKRFAELSDGKFELRGENGSFTAMLELPLIDEEMLKANQPLFSSSGYVYYKTDIPDIVELKMLEIKALFSA